MSNGRRRGAIRLLRRLRPLRLAERPRRCELLRNLIFRLARAGAPCCNRSFCSRRSRGLRLSWGTSAGSGTPRGVARCRFRYGRVPARFAGIDERDLHTMIIGPTIERAPPEQRAVNGDQDIGADDIAHAPAPCGRAPASGLGKHRRERTPNSIWSGRARINRSGCGPESPIQIPRGRIAPCQHYPANSCICPYLKGVVSRLGRPAACACMSCSPPCPSLPRRSWRLRGRIGGHHRRSPSVFARSGLAVRTIRKWSGGC